MTKTMGLSDTAERLPLAARALLIFCLSAISWRIIVLAAMGSL